MNLYLEEVRGDVLGEVPDVTEDGFQEGGQLVRQTVHFDHQA